MQRAALVLVGGELLSGTRTDTNGPWLARQLAALGVAVVETRVVGDDAALIAHALVDCARRASWILVSGGLGPTADDVTREGLARAAGVSLAHDEAAWQQIRDVLAARGREPARGERCQALVPAGGHALRNDAGVAPGIRCEVGAATVLAFPGVPHELHHLFDEHAREEIAAGAGAPPATRTIWVAGVPESEVAERLEGLDALRGVAVASYPHTGEVELVLRADGADAETRAAAARDAVRQRLAGRVYEPAPGERIEHVVVRALAAGGATLATAESFTGGLLAQMVTRVPGASAVYRVGWVTYAAEEKIERLGVDPDVIARHGVASEAVAAAMAAGARRVAGSTFALATTGAAGPAPLEQEGHAPTPPGRVHIALAGAGEAARGLALELPFARDLVRRYAAVRAFDLLRQALR